VNDPETFLTALYVLVDEFVQAERPMGRRPGPPAALSASEVLTLAVFGQWARFGSERDFYRYAATRLRPAFPRRPARSQYNRLGRRHRPALARLGLWLAERLAAPRAAYECLDSTGVPVRNAKRRGAGWLAGLADIGTCSRLGWSEGFHLLTAVDPAGVVTGFGFGPASANDRALAETLLALRRCPDPRLPSAGRPASNVYVADAGFAGQAVQPHWLAAYGAEVVAPPQTGSARAWAPAERRWLAGLRQVVETVHDRLLAPFRLDRERPHALEGFRARLAAKVGLHNFCIWLNRQQGRPDLAIAEVLGW
jgi:hypothetical protein